MSLEQMNKPDLVKYARSIEQKSKQLESELEELKLELNKNKEEKELLDLPFTAVSIIPNSKTRFTRLIELKFNMAGQCEVIQDRELMEHQTLYRAENLLGSMEKINKGK